MKANSRGFTIVELTLAIAFVGVLLIAVVTTAVGLGRTYQKGITLRDVNQTGREISDVMRRDLAAASPKELKVQLLPNASNPETARICTGSVSYLINFARHLNSGSGQVIKASNQPSAPTAKLMRVLDSSGANCLRNASGQYQLFVQGTNQQELLGASKQGDATNLAIHAIEVQTLNQQADSQLLRLKLRLGTNQIGSVDADRCADPSSSSANFDYCALYDFETIIRAGYRSNQ